MYYSLQKHLQEPIAIFRYSYYDDIATVATIDGNTVQYLAGI